jgi:hypothetical protein
MSAIREKVWVEGGEVGLVRPFIVWRYGSTSSLISMCGPRYGPVVLDVRNMWQASNKVKSYSKILPPV